MQEDNYNIGTRIEEGQLYHSGIAYIVIPSDTDRDKYIGQCYKTNTVSIFSEFNGYSNRVPIDINSINFIEFPKDVNSFGSAVSFVIDPVRQSPIITGVYKKQDELGDLVENQFKFKRKLGGNVVEIIGSANGKHLIFNIEADQSGNIDINVKSNDNNGKVNIRVDGDTNIQSLNDTNLKQYNRLLSKTTNVDDEDTYSSFEETPDKHSFVDKNFNLSTKKLSINNGSENFVLGQKLQSFLNDLIDELSKTTVTTALGQMPVLNAEQIALFKERTSTLLSQIGFIDK